MEDASFAGTLNCEDTGLLSVTGPEQTHTVSTAVSESQLLSPTDHTGSESALCALGNRAVMRPHKHHTYP